MHALATLAAFAAAVSSAEAAFQGFNYASTFTTGAAKLQSDFEAEFKTSQGLEDAPAGGFNSARLYTMIQAGSANDPISAIPAAISTKTSLLLGLWASAGDAGFANEVAALKNSINQYGDEFAKLVAGISVGSEDLYRISPTGLLNKENPGAQPATIAKYIKDVRDAIAGTVLSSAPVGHVDTWTSWVNGSNQAVIDNCDWIGVDAYPYFQDTMNNAIANNKGLFDDAIGATKAAVGGKPVWITETGFPVSGKTVGLAVPGLDTAKTFWDDVGCPMFGSVNVWWYTMQDAAPTTPNPSFGIIGNSLTTTPLFDISCKDAKPASSSSSGSSATSSASATGSSTGGGAGGGGGVSTSLSTLETTTTSGASTPTTGAGGTTSTTTTGSGAGGGGTNTTVTNTGGSSTPRPTSSPTTTPNTAAVLHGSTVAAFLAVMAAILVY